MYERVQYTEEQGGLHGAKVSNIQTDSVVCVYWRVQYTGKGCLRVFYLNVNDKGLQDKAYIYNPYCPRNRWHFNIY